MRVFTRPAFPCSSSNCTLAGFTTLTSHVRATGSHRKDQLKLKGPARPSYDTTPHDVGRDQVAPPPDVLWVIGKLQSCLRAWRARSDVSNVTATSHLTPRSCQWDGWGWDDVTLGQDGILFQSVWLWRPCVSRLIGSLFWKIKSTLVLLACAVPQQVSFNSSFANPWALVL